MIAKVALLASLLTSLIPALTQTHTTGIGTDSEQDTDANTNTETVRDVYFQYVTVMSANKIIDEQTSLEQNTDDGNELNVTKYNETHDTQLLTVQDVSKPGLFRKLLRKNAKRVKSAKHGIRKRQKLKRKLNLKLNPLHQGSINAQNDTSRKTQEPHCAEIDTLMDGFDVNYYEIDYTDLLDSTFQKLALFPLTEQALNGALYKVAFGVKKLGKLFGIIEIGAKIVTKVQKIMHDLVVNGISKLGKAIENIVLTGISKIEKVIFKRNLVIDDILEVLTADEEEPLLENEYEDVENLVLKETIDDFN